MLGTGAGHVHREEVIAGAIQLAVLVAAVRADHVDAIADAGGVLEVRLVAGGEADPDADVDRRERRAARAAGVEAHPLLLVVAVEEVGRVDHDGHRAVAGQPVAARRRPGGARGGAAAARARRATDPTSAAAHAARAGRSASAARPGAPPVAPRDAAAATAASSRASGRPGRRRDRSCPRRRCSRARRRCRHPGPRRRRCRCRSGFPRRRRRPSCPPRRRCRRPAMPPPPVEPAMPPVPVAPAIPHVPPSPVAPSPPEPPLLAAPPPFPPVTSGTNIRSTATTNRDGTAGDDEDRAAAPVTDHS